MKPGCREAQGLYEDNTQVLSATDAEKPKQHARTTVEWVESLSQQVDDVIKLVLFVLVAVGCDWLLVVIGAIASHTRGGKLAVFL